MGILQWEMHFRFSVFLAAATYCIAASAIPTGACNDYSSKIPNVSRHLCEAAELQDTQARSVLNRPIWMRDIRPDDARLRVLVIGGIHGDEMSSSSMVFHWINQAQVPPADMPDPIHWRFIPALNPDGLFSRPARRVNAHGVDLNRNFPTPNWARDAHLIVSIHAPYGVLDFDGPSVPPSKLGRLYLDQVGIFPGSLGNYGGIHKRVPVVTIELPSASRTPLDAEMRQMWLDLLRWTAERLGSNATMAARDTASP